MTPNAHAAMIIHEVALKHAVKLCDFMGPRKWPELVAARKEAAHRLFNEVKHLNGQPAGYEWIGRMMNRHHTSVMNLLGMIDRKRKKDQAAERIAKETTEWAA